MIKPDAVLRTFVSLQAMKELRRQGGVFYGERMMEADTVAGHSFTVTCLAWFLAVSFKAEDCGSDINVQKVLEMGLCHDMPEAITGDIPAPFKRKLKGLGMGRKLEEAELEVFKELAAPLEKLGMKLPDILKEYGKMDSKEAAIVKVADRLDAYVHALATVSVHGLIQAWRFYNSKLYGELHKKGENSKGTNDKDFWDSLAEWFCSACKFLAGPDGLCPIIPEDEKNFSDGK